MLWKKHLYPLKSRDVFSWRSSCLIFNEENRMAKRQRFSRESQTFKWHFSLPSQSWLPRQNLLISAFQNVLLEKGELISHNKLLELGCKLSSICFYLLVGAAVVPHKEILITRSHFLPHNSLLHSKPQIESTVGMNPGCASKQTLLQVSHLFFHSSWKGHELVAIGYLKAL